MKAPVDDRMLVTTLPPKTFKPRRYRPGNLGNWSGHLPFAADLIAAMRPALLVELGTHYGESYFGMCQAVEESAVSCKCYAVDTWRGDPHAGYYDEAVFEDVSKYNEATYGAFSKLLRMTFDDAREQFGDETVDLLHIDGLHTYDAVRHDFETWFPKVRPGGIVLMHDTFARHADFQVWKLWEDLAGRFPTFEFTHYWGLGVLLKPGRAANESQFTSGIVTASPTEQSFLRHYYELQATALERSQVLLPAARTESMFQVFPHVQGGFSEASSVSAIISSGTWQHIRLELPQGTAGGRVRVDPADRPCVVHLAGILVRRAVDEAIVKSWTDDAAMNGFTLTGDLMRVPGAAGARFLSTGYDPRFLLPELGDGLADQPLVFEARVRIENDLSSAVAALQATVASNGQTAASERASVLQDQQDQIALRNEQVGGAVKALDAERDAHLLRIHQLTAEIRNLQTERMAVAADYRRIHSVNEAIMNEAVSLKNRLAAETERGDRLANEAAHLRAETAALAENLKDIVAERQQAAAELKVVYQSRSWRLTAPLRRIRRAIG